MDTIQRNLIRLQEKITNAAHRAGRHDRDIQLVAVSKTVAWPLMLQAAAAGQTVMGENYIQEAREKITLARQHASGRNLIWHFIGHLQSNKAAVAVDLFDVIESVDRLKLARALDKRAAACGKRQKILVQVNVGREPQKSGVRPEACEDLLQELQGRCRHLEVLGLMAMPPWSPDPEAARPYFREMRELVAAMASAELLGDRGRAALSMGMSADFEVAIEEGATLVRIGTALFGPRVK